MNKLNLSEGEPEQSVLRGKTAGGAKPTAGVCKMSRFGMGFGKDNPKDIQGFRPAVRISSAKVQQMKNKWFTDHKEPSVRPDWFQTKHKPEQRVGGPDLGEWKVVWHPRSRMDSPTLPARKVMMTLKDDEEKEQLKKMLAEGLTKKLGGGGRGGAGVPMTSRSEPMAAMADTDELRAMSRGSKRLGTAGSRGGERAPSRGSDRPLSRASTVASGRSGRSSRSYGTGMSSTVTTNAKELLERIQGLEEALKQEQTLRKKMQSVISLEAWAEET